MSAGKAGSLFHERVASGSRDSFRRVIGEESDAGHLERIDNISPQVNAIVTLAAYVTEIDGMQMDSYIDWMHCYSVTASAHPAISAPCGFTP